MPQIKASHLIISITMAVALAGCGDKNDKSTYYSDSGHPSGWAASHKTSAKTGSDGCTKCHGENLTGGIAKVSCFSTPQTSRSGFACHATNPIVNTNCSSCHGTPPNGTSAPNRAGAHATHLALVGVTCDSCHNGAGSGTANHAKTVTVLLQDSLKAKTVTTTFAYNAANGTCSAIICHGGVTTPNWSTGSITVATDCLKCHEQGTASQTPQYNSFFSGIKTGANLHMLHLLLRIPGTATPITCTECHNSSALTGHFSGLVSPVFEGTAANSIGGAGTFVNNYVPYTTAVPSGSCSSSCHVVLFNNPQNWIN